jgi:hypothetical protein
MWAVDASTFTKSSVGPVENAAVDPITGHYWTAVQWPTMLDPAGVLIRDGATDKTIDVVSLGGTNGYCPGRIDFDAKHRVVWISAQCGQSNDPIWVVNADTYMITNGPIGSGGISGQGAVNPATGRYYIHVSGSVPQRVDPRTFALSRTAFGPVISVNASSNLLYAQGANGSLQIVDGAPDPEVVLTNVTLPFRCSLHPIGIDPVRNRIYVPNAGSNEIVILDGSTGQNLGTILLDKKLGNIKSVHGLAFDATYNRVYAIAWGKGDLYSWLYAVQGGHQQALRVPRPTSGPVLNPRFNKVYIWAAPAAVD